MRAQENWKCRSFHSRCTRLYETEVSPTEINLHGIDGAMGGRWAGGTIALSEEELRMVNEKLEDYKNRRTEN